MLKKLLQLLLNTRTTPEEAAHSAMPSDKYTRLVDNGTIGSEWTPQAFSGIAAYDGYLFFAGTSTSAVPIVGISTAGCASNLTFPWEGARLATTIPIAKGQTWTVQGSSLKDVIIDLSKTVALGGGGYNSFVWRALSCLRPSFNFSLKNSLLAEATGFPTNPIQLFKRRISHLQRQESGFLSSLLATGGSASKGLPRKFCLATGRFGRGAIQQRHLIKAFVFLSQKAGLWPTYYRQTPRAYMSSLFRVSAINSFQTGGALC